MKKYFRALEARNSVLKSTLTTEIVLTLGYPFLILISSSLRIDLFLTVMQQDVDIIIENTLPGI